MNLFFKPHWGPNFNWWIRFNYSELSLRTSNLYEYLPKEWGSHIGLIKQWWLQKPTVFSEIFRKDGKAADHFIAGYYVFHKSKHICWLCYYSVLKMNLMCDIRWNIITFESWELSNGELIMNTEKKGPMREERHQKNVNVPSSQVMWMAEEKKKRKTVVSHGKYLRNQVGWGLRTQNGGLFCPCKESF